MTIYTPTVWQDGDIITAQKLNKIEDRIEELQDFKNRVILIEESISIPSSGGQAM